jgi:hypothetical protein
MVYDCWNADFKNNKCKLGKKCSLDCEDYEQFKGFFFEDWLKGSKQADKGSCRADD